MAAGEGENLWSSPAEMWRSLLKLYPEAIRLKAVKKSKPQARKELMELDKWYQEELPELIQSRDEPHLTREEIRKLMTWKLARGKFRPALPGLVAQNDEDAVVRSSKAALSKMPDLSAAINALCQLRGIGPATASAVLAAGCPASAPFMADECVLGTPGISVIKYDLKCYLQYAEAIEALRSRLQSQDSASEWSCHKVELALWSHHVISQLQPSLLPLAESADNTPTKPLAESADNTPTKPLVESADNTPTKPLAESADKTPTKPLAESADKTRSKPLADGADKTRSKPLADGADKTRSKPLAESADNTPNRQKNKRKSTTKTGQRKRSKKS